MHACSPADEAAHGYMVHLRLQVDAHFQLHGRVTMLMEEGMHGHTDTCQPCL